MFTCTLGHKIHFLYQDKRNGDVSETTSILLYSMRLPSDESIAMIFVIAALYQPILTV